MLRSMRRRSPSPNSISAASHRRDVGGHVAGMASFQHVNPSAARRVALRTPGTAADAVKPVLDEDMIRSRAQGHAHALHPAGTRWACCESHSSARPLHAHPLSCWTLGGGETRGAEVPGGETSAHARGVASALSKAARSAPGKACCARCCAFARSDGRRRGQATFDLRTTIPCGTGDRSASLDLLGQHLGCRWRPSS